MKDEIARLTKMVNALMDRAERSTRVLQSSDFSLFQTAVMLQDQVKKRTAELEMALRENEKINRALRESEAKFRGLVSQPLVGVVMIEDGKFSYSNAKFDEMLGYGADEIRKLGPLEISSESCRPIIEEYARKLLSGEVERVERVFRAARKNGTQIDAEIHSSAMDIGGKKVLISLILDVTERIRIEAEVKALQEKLRYQSIHDPLTGLFNRRYLDETLDHELISAEHDHYPVSVIMGDLDHFKAVNDHYGHIAGDEVLRVFGNLMKRHAREGDIYCRYGGEEFLLVLPHVAKHVAVERAEQLRRTMAATPVFSGPSQIAMTASFGVATSPSDGRTGDELIAAADNALYAAKASGRNRVNVSSGSISSTTSAPPIHAALETLITNVPVAGPV